MNGHFSDVSALTTTNPKRQKKLEGKKESMRSDTFAKHFQQHFLKDATPTTTTCKTRTKGIVGRQSSVMC
eukprot:14989608-Ditylum_brightwellii.AAC.1